MHIVYPSIQVDGLITCSWYQSFDWPAHDNRSMTPPYEPMVSSETDLANFNQAGYERPRDPGGGLRPPLFVMLLMCFVFICVFFVFFFVFYFVFLLCCFCVLWGFGGSGGVPPWVAWFFIPPPEQKKQRSSISFRNVAPPGRKMIRFMESL